jgi:endonuclease-3
MTRVNQRLRLSGETDPVKIERDLMALVPEREWTLYSHRVIAHGREVCDARRPLCEACALRELCPFPGSPAARARKKRT